MEKKKPQINYKYSDLSGEANQIVHGPFGSVQTAKSGLNRTDSAQIQVKLCPY